MLEYSVASRTASTVTVALRGDMVGEAWATRMREFLQEHFVEDVVSLISLDLSEVRVIDLEGIGALVALARNAERQSKGLVILSPTEAVKRRLETTGMLGYLTSGRVSLDR